MGIFGKVKKGTQLYSIVYLKCPKCQEGNLFTHKNPYNFKYTLSMPDKCTNCGISYKFEPGFYSAALWTSYPIVIIITGFLCVLFMVWLAISINISLVLIGIILLVLQPLIMRWGRAILINNFIGYDEAYKMNGKL
ncbi:MAG: DUF983 domain-containing protein [Bacteroidetes bacterium]|nr:DUF983 domain-containing protein [Bacteroidota bacterium]